ncbi:MAG: LysR family transcriptional regulator [Leptolyngbya sp. SIO4C1]|nr:LysR family transcriptional regulator [Leptolyngbya sp. SIO4C1]
MSKSLDRLTLLQTFVRIADAGSISAAARNLGLSQPSVSRQLVELESRFNAQLMHRTTHTLSLTEAGAELLLDARRLLDEWEALEEKHIASEDTVRGRLKVIAPVALGQVYLAELALQFQQQYPLVSLSWQLADHTIRFTETGCDCWIKVGDISDESLRVEPLGQVERIVVAAPKLITAASKPKTPAAAQQLPCVALDPFEGGHIPLTHLSGRAATLSPVVRMATNNIFALHRATLAGLGFSVMPRWLIESDLQQQRLIDLLPGWQAPRLTIQAAYLPGRHRPLRLRRFLQSLKVAVSEISGIE